MIDLTEELAEVIRNAPVTGGTDVDLSGPLAHHIRRAGYRKIFDAACGLSNVKDPSDVEAAEAWMRWANLAMNDEIGAIGAMKQMLTEFGYRKP